MIYISEKVAFTLTSTSSSSTPAVVVEIMRCRNVYRALMSLKCPAVATHAARCRSATTRIAACASLGASFQWVTRD